MPHNDEAVAEDHSSKTLALQYLSEKGNEYVSCISHRSITTIHTMIQYGYTVSRYIVQGIAILDSHLDNEP